MTRTRIVCALAACVALSPAAFAQTAPPAERATATRIHDRVDVDGVLDEPFWETLPAITDFIQREPAEGAPVSERTEVRIAYDDKNLYFGFNLYDATPSGIVRSVLQREGPSQNDDHVMIGLDTYHDRRNAYIFGLNPFATQEDAIVTDEGQPDWNWEGVYESATRITSSGWTLEVAIPFSTIRVAEGATPEMGVAFYRQIRRKNEEAMWPAIGRNFGNKFFQISRYATLDGFSNLAPGRNLQVKPYINVGARKPSKDSSPGAELTRNVGADVRYGVTSNATLDLTYNTDFAQAEADNAQLNLTRFSVFFPEKRDFFLERNGLFTFGAPSNQNQGGYRQQLEAATFFSRRIGLNQPILGGGRYSGKSGIFTMGYLDIQTKTDGPLAAQNFGVARIKADISPRRTVGAIFTNVQGGGTTNRAAGGDLSFRFLRSSALAAWISNVWDPRYSSSTAAGNANLLLRNDRYSYQFDYLNVGRHFDPAIGYVRRLDMVRYTNDLGFNPRPAGGIVRQYHYNAGGFQIFGQDGAKQSTQAYLKFAATMQAGDEIGGSLTNDSDRPTTAFQIVNATLPAGNYSYTHPRVYANTSSARRISEQFSVEAGNFYSGTKTTYIGSVTVKVKPQFQVTYNAERDDVNLPVAGGAFTTQLHSVNLFVAANRNLFSNSLLQYDNVSHQFQANIRVRWIHHAGSDLFLVYNTSHRLGTSFDPRDVIDDQRAGIVKLTYLIRF
jgi:hypothetical protein